MIMDCDYCNGEGTIPIYFEEVMGFAGSNEEAQRLAGKVHHEEVCPKCHGTCEEEEDV